MIRYKIRTRMYVLLGALLFAVYFFKNIDNPETSYLQKHLKKNASSYKYTYPRCEKNTNAAKMFGFRYFPRDIQDFLYYRHCRHFPLILDLPNKCGTFDQPHDIFLLLVIKSSPLHYERREVLRKTWAKERIYKGVWIRRIFTLGTVHIDIDKQRMNKLLKMEQEEHNDILQWDFDDTFLNLTLKQILFFEWMDRNCPLARFLLNGDDDVFANTDNMVDYLQGLTNNNGSQHLFTGTLIKNAIPVRWRSSKYFIPFPMYPSNLYPSYCGGGGFLLSHYTALMIHKFSDSIPIFPIDDVYMGMCLAKARLEPESHWGVKTLGWYVPSSTLDKYDPCYIKELLLFHKLSPAYMYVIWQQIHEPGLKCGVTNWLNKTKNPTYKW